MLGFWVSGVKSLGQGGAGRIQGEVLGVRGLAIRVQGL